MGNRAWAVAVVGALAASACTGGAIETLSHDFPELTAAPGEERNYICQSWTLNNDQPIQMNALRLDIGPGWHHSNWLYAPEGDFAGPDGTWACAERGFELVAAGLSGGVIYTQSPEVEAEAVRFGAGVAVVIPPRSKIIAEIHLLNATPRTLRTHGHLELESLSDAATTTRLAPMAFSYYPLALPPAARSQFTTECDLATVQDSPLDFRIHFLAPHYHALGTGMTVEAYHSDGTSRLIYETTRPIGESLFYSPAVPFALGGAQGIRFTCTYDNPGSSEVRFGSGQADEMCVLFAFTDSRTRWLGGVPEASPNVALAGKSDDPRMHRFGNRCLVAPFSR